MQTYSIDEHYDMDDAVTRLGEISLASIEATKGREDVQQLANVNWDVLQVGQFTKPKTWRMCEFGETEGGMEEVQFRVQGILVGKELPPVGGSVLQTKRARQYLRQNIKICGGWSETFAEASQAIEKIYIMFAGQFQDGMLEPWSPSHRDGHTVIEANTRYMMPKALCSEEDVQVIDEYVDPNGTLRRAMEEDFVCGPDNVVQYMQKMRPLGQDTMRKVSPTQFKIGDIVEAVLTFVCYPTQNGTVKMTIGLKALALLDHHNRDNAAILRMRERQKALETGNSSGSLKRSRESKFVTLIGVDILFQILDKANSPKDVNSLSRTSTHFRAGTGRWHQSNAFKFASSHGVDHPAWLLNALSRTDSIISGPDVLSVWIPDSPLTGRLEVFTPNRPNAYREMIDHLVDTEGFEIQDVKLHDNEKNAFREVYEDFDFGATVQAVLTLEKHSPDTPIITVAELMTTLFMNFITGSSIVSLYPVHMFRRKGLMNYDGPVLAKSMKITELFQQAGFQLKTEVKHKQKCGFSHCCPNTIRHYTDGRTHATDIINPFDIIRPHANKPLAFWRLRCGGMCGTRIAEPMQMEAIAVIYGTAKYYKVGL
ncbi:hypothetical protein MD484_g788, partial [Candolleomyces efflorescens]